MKKQLLTLIILIATYTFLGLGISQAQTERIKILIPLNDVKTFKVVPEASDLTWSVKEKSLEQKGELNISSGELRLLSNNDLLDVLFEVDMNSVSKSELQDSATNSIVLEQMKSKSFFWTEKYPKAFFKLKTLLPLTKSVNNERKYKITGELTIKGITHTVTIPIKVKVEGDRAVLTGTTTINRSSYKLKFDTSKSMPENDLSSFSKKISLDLLIIFKK